jgi:hypothetical protein
MAPRLNIKMFNVAENDINFDSFVQFPLFWFRCVFFNFTPLNETASLCETIVHYARRIYARFILIDFAWAIISMTLHSIYIAESLVKVFANIPNAVSLMLIGLKAFASIKHEKVIWEIFEECRATFAERGNQNAKYNIKNYLDSYHLYIKIYSGTILFVFLPILFPIVLYIYDGTMEITVDYWSV